MGRPSPLPVVQTVIPEGHLHLGEKLGGSVRVAWLERGGLVKRVAVRCLSGLGERSERAIRASALVRHPNVVEVLELVREGERALVVSEMIDGMSLASLARAYRAVQRRVPLELALFIAIEVAEGLASARNARSPSGRLSDLTHLDLSARSVLLSHHGEVKVEGFGLGHPSADGSGIRSVRGVAQRLATTAPEIARGKDGDARSDVFSLAVILHEMLASPRFPESLSDDEVCAMAKSGEFAADPLAPQIPEGVREVLHRALHTDPRERPAHAGILAYDLRAIALRMGVLDARVFLRSALFEMNEAAAALTEV